MMGTNKIYLKAIKLLLQGDLKEEELVEVFEEHLNGLRSEISNLTETNKYYKERLTFLLEGMSDVNDMYKKEFKNG